MQLTPDPLLPIEQIAIGGIDTVRGYRENQLVVDNGWMTSAELRIPLGQVTVPGLSEAPDDGALQLVPLSTRAAAGTSRRRTPRRTHLRARRRAALAAEPAADPRLDFAPPLITSRRPRRMTCRIWRSTSSW